MSNSKFAIKRIKARENNPEIWDAAHQLAEEWQSDVNKITFNDANWRVLNRNLLICTFERNWSDQHAVRRRCRSRGRVLGRPASSFIMVPRFKRF
jgi:hypothetical protein